MVGVVTSVRHAAIDEHRPFSLYLAAGAMEHAQFLVVKTAQPADSLEKAVRIAIAGVDPNQPVFLSVSMRSLIADSLADRRFIASLLAVTAFLALVMSSAGVYGVVSYTTSRRTLEIGVRMALGATRNHVQFLVFRQGFLARGGGPYHRIGSDHGADERATAGRSGAWSRALVADFSFGEHSVVCCSNRLLGPRTSRDEDRPDVRIAV